MDTKFYAPIFFFPVGEKFWLCCCVVVVTKKNKFVFGVFILLYFFFQNDAKSAMAFRLSVRVEVRPMLPSLNDWITTRLWPIKPMPGCKKNQKKKKNKKSIFGCWVGCGGVGCAFFFFFKKKKKK